MEFEIHLGIPEVKAFWDSLEVKKKAGSLSEEEETLRKKWGKAMAHLQMDPFYPGLRSHEIDDLSRRYGVKVFQSYLENSNPRAMRMYWVYGPKPGMITVIVLEPHPEDRKKQWV
jgi:hypothetical protein